MLSEISFQITANRPKHLRSHPFLVGFVLLDL
jgi:hypothetical protein